MRGVGVDHNNSGVGKAALKFNHLYLLIKKFLTKSRTSGIAVKHHFHIKIKFVVLKLTYIKM